MNNVILPNVEKGCLVKLPIPILAFVRAFPIPPWPKGARGALSETSLKIWSWPTLPKAAAVWGEIDIL